MELDRLLEPFAASSDARAGRALVTALKASPVRASLRADALRRALAKSGPTVQKEADELYAQLDADAAKQKARLEELLASLKDGDVRRGQTVFHSTKASCS